MLSLEAGEIIVDYIADVPMYGNCIPAMVQVLRNVHEELRHAPICPNGFQSRVDLDKMICVCGVIVVRHILLYAVGAHNN